MVTEMLKLIQLPELEIAIPGSFPVANSSALPWPAPLRSAPKVLLLDEPLSALDAKVRVSLATRSAPFSTNWALPPSMSPTTRKRRCPFPTAWW